MPYSVYGDFEFYPTTIGSITFDVFEIDYELMIFNLDLSTYIRPRSLYKPTI